MTEIPLFPLGAVLLPYGRMPLQIFEQRYLDLVKDCMRTGGSFGVVWIRQGSEVARPGNRAPDLGDYGTTARIVDWDQLPNGLLGITIQGVQRFDLYDTRTQENNLVLGEVKLGPEPEPQSMREQWQSLADVLRSLEHHPHVRRMNLTVDYNDAWQVGGTLAQLLPLEERVKYELLGLDGVEELMFELDIILNQISGEDAR